MADSHASRNRRPPQVAELPKTQVVNQSLICHRCGIEFDSLVAVVRHMEQAHLGREAVRTGGND
jgi:hypothetical protein